jgi:hypothetical protein
MAASSGALSILGTASQSTDPSLETSALPCPSPSSP